jgi:membrane associated rhomboid family serine protease
MILLPWRVDVPEERLPVMNWLIILATVLVFAIQVSDAMKRRAISPQPTARHDRRELTRRAITEPNRPAEAVAPRPSISRRLILNGWGLKGLFGYMWLHGSLFHLLGNMWFLWLFGNAVCAKVGNLRYLGLYIFLGVAAGVAHLLGSSGPALGASGAINGIVGMYLVLFFENDITCYFMFWFILPYIRCFTVSSFWMILLWLLWDIAGLVMGGSHVAYWAHIGGFAAGFGVAVLMCTRGWVTMERYERSLVQMWQQRRGGGQSHTYDSIFAEDALSQAEEPTPEPTIPLPDEHPRQIPYLDMQDSEPVSSPRNEPSPTPPKQDAAPIRVPCTCGYTIRASRQYEGKLVHCPRCHATVRIPYEGEACPASSALSQSTEPDRPPSDDFIRFTCRCGQAIRTPIRYAGRFAKCPACGARLQIPEPS